MTPTTPLCILTSPIAYIYGAEVSLLKKTGNFIGSDQIFQLLASIRNRLATDSSDPLSIIDALAKQYGEMEVSDTVALDVFRCCKYPSQKPALVGVNVG